RGSRAFGYNNPSSHLSNTKGKEATAAMCSCRRSPRLQGSVKLNVPQETLVAS
ncbi:hypothetical protein AKJ16_DCAP00620, partial [Drosera capensis]